MQPNIINEQDLEKAKRLIKASKRPLVVIAQDETYNRKILEYGKFDILSSPEKAVQKQSLKQTDSGINHIMAKIASKNNIAIGINIEEILSLSREQKAIRLAKIIQNIQILRKAKTKLAIKTNNKQGAFHLLLSLGASTQQAKDSLYF